MFNIVSHEGKSASWRPQGDRYHGASIRPAKQQYQPRWGCGETDPTRIAGGNMPWRSPQCHSLVASYKTNMHLPCNPAVILRAFIQRNEHLRSYNNLYLNVCSGSIWNQQKCPRTRKCLVVSLYSLDSGILCISKREKVLLHCSNLGELPGNYTKRKKANLRKWHTVWWQKAD